MTNFLQIIKSTPFYVWGIFAYVLFFGIKNIKTRIVYVPKFFIFPLLLFFIQYKNFFSQNSRAFTLIVFLATLGSFFVHRSKKVKVIKSLKSVEVIGSYIPLLILLFVFFMKYYLGYLESMDYEIFSKYLSFENRISGAFSGYFLGRAINYVYQYWKESK
ncbi:hypothetical protein K737_300307 [Holospora undulata HU1]|uniref:Transmembrane protein n=1 Tax=Holospora undulata HU1 TaxID=1321371 RepID=A0A061JIB0_9PROT|nr:hypothetical protein K737_300307 [Holospora undulata HU1]